MAAGDSEGSDRIECSNHICELQLYALAFLASAVTAALVSSKDFSTQKTFDSESKILKDDD